MGLRRPGIITGLSGKARRYHGEGDIRDFETLLEHSRGVDYIIHTAAQPAMTISEEDPELDFSTNVRGTFNVLKVARELDIPVASCGTVHI